LNSRKGKFTILSHIIWNKSYEIAAVFREMRFVPLRVEYLGYCDMIEYIGMSPMFDKIEQGCIAPEYTIIVTQDEKNNVSSVKVERK